VAGYLLFPQLRKLDRIKDAAPDEAMQN